MNSFAEYIREIRKSLEKGDSTEHTHRTALEALLEACDKEIDATNEPRRIACGAPDFNITRKGVPVGHVETKDVGVNLDEMERGKGPNGEQFKRYSTLPNWILTDYLEFRWYAAGEKRLTVRVADFDGKGCIKAAPDGDEKLAQLLTAFYHEPALTVGTAKELAQRMAGMTRIIRDLIIASFKHETEETERKLVQEARKPYGGAMPSRGPWLHNWLAAFRETLIPDLTETEFADMFAQTLAYGLFAARIHAPANREFSREMAAFKLPKTNPFLRKLFAEIAGVDMPDTVAWAVDDLVNLLRHADMAEIMQDFGKSKGKEDPVVHFYETFLAAYDPKVRDQRGVRYTPEPVVQYIVRSVDWLLQTRFNRPQGLADDNTFILDPAVGTATFLYFVLTLIFSKFARQRGQWDGYVEKHLLNRLFGFEILMAPYAIAHLKLGMLLEETGYSFSSDQRLGIFLTNTLEESARRSDRLFADWISEEANAAANVKARLPIMVVLGNPPYANFGRMNRNPWILGLLNDYKRGLNEKKLNLDDDFIKFIRFAQWRIEKTGHGIVGFITSNTYLDGITHRRMRESLMQAFDEIYILDLHGSSKKKEKTPDGGKDENVFDITVGVSILLAVRLAETGPSSDGRAPARVFHAELWGARQGKYDWLWQNDASQTPWTELSPTGPHFFFVPKDFSLEQEYDCCPRLIDAFLENNTGIQTKRDCLTIHFSEDGIRLAVQDTCDMPVDTLRQKYNLPEDGRDWTVAWAKADIESAGVGPSRFRRILYRPFDWRYTYFTGKTKGFLAYPRRETMRHMLAGPNIGLITLRINGAGDEFVVLCTSNIIEKGSLPRGNYSIFPLYLYSSDNELDALAGRRPNINPEFLKALAVKLKLPQEGPHGLPHGVTPEDIFHYAYAVFHSPTYRTRYAEFLKIDFPRLPLTGNRDLFFRLAALGGELVALHLMESPKLNDLITEFPVKGTDTVEKVQYNDKDGRVWINPTQYFGGVPTAIWNFHIGGYQVCEKWLKDRKGRKLTYEETRHYQQIVVALNETIRLMTEIDEVIRQHGDWPDAFYGNVA
ncbi:MAG: N-6 DNA methylase [Syntrophaceae bacterium]|nr:N-6 DNA methylase [Syntrophaceae bacterium]